MANKKCAVSASDSYQLAAICAQVQSASQSNLVHQILELTRNVEELSTDYNLQRFCGDICIWTTSTVHANYQTKFL